MLASKQILQLNYVSHQQRADSSVHTDLCEEQ